MTRLATTYTTRPDTGRRPRPARLFAVSRPLPGDDAGAAIRFFRGLVVAAAICVPVWGSLAWLLLRVL